MLLLTREDIYSLITMKEAIDTMGEAFAALTLGRARMPMRQSMDVGGGATLLCMPSKIATLPSSVVKLVTVVPDNARRGRPTVQAIVAYFNDETGEPLALLEGSSLTALRTGAAGGLAARYLARRDSEVVAVFGAGVQGRSQLEALAAVLPITDAYVVNPTPSKAERFSKEMSEKLGIRVVPSEARRAVEQADVIVTATTSNLPVFESRWVKAGTHINAVGSFRPDSREVEGSLVARAKVVVDSLEAAKAEAGDIIMAVAEGLMRWDDVYGELGEIVLGIKPGRQGVGEITLFKSVGLAVQDAAIAHLAYTKAVRENVGRHIAL
jgi:alanine dehydrogenase